MKNIQQYWKKVKEEKLSYVCVLQNKKNIDKKLLVSKPSFETGAITS